MRYSEYTDVLADDQTIACHPVIDACNGSIAYRLLEHVGFPCTGRTALDLGAGTGQMSRFLLGFPGLLVEALDVDPESERYFKNHPELMNLQFYRLDFLADDLPKDYDAIIVRGVYHHIPKASRPTFIKKLRSHAQIVIIADEGIREYGSEAERLKNCDDWYSYVIGESRRRGLTKLAEIESHYLEHERLASADDGGDFKESPSHLVADAKLVGVAPKYIDRFGPWERAGGGFFTATFAN